MTSGTTGEQLQAYIYFGPVSILMHTILVNFADLFLFFNLGVLSKTETHGHG